MTWTDLERLWEARDQRYAIRRYLGMFQPLTQAEIAAIRSWRREEVDMLAVDRDRAWTALYWWAPPTR